MASAVHPHYGGITETSPLRAWGKKALGTDLGATPPADSSVAPPAKSRSSTASKVSQQHAATSTPITAKRRRILLLLSRAPKLSLSSRPLRRSPPAAAQDLDLRR